MRTLVTGATGLVGGTAADALEAFGDELPRGLRINAVSPTVLTEATGHHASFPGIVPVSAADVGQAFVKFVRGIQTRRVFVL